MMPEGDPEPEVGRAFTFSDHIHLTSYSLVQWIAIGPAQALQVFVHIIIGLPVMCVKMLFGLA